MQRNTAIIEKMDAEEAAASSFLKEEQNHGGKKGAAAQELNLFYGVQKHYLHEKAVHGIPMYVLCMFISNIAPILIITGVVKMPPTER